MNLIAMTGVGLFGGMALRMLVELWCQWTEGREGYGRETYEAYAPEPMVLDTMRKGRFLGRGATCDWMRSSQSCVFAKVGCCVDLRLVERPFCESSIERNVPNAVRGSNWYSIARRKRYAGNAIKSVRVLSSVRVSRLIAPSRQVNTARVLGNMFTLSATSPARPTQL